MLRQVKRVWLIVNIDLLCVPLLAGDNRCIWGKKKRQNYVHSKKRWVVFSTQMLG